MSHPVNRAVEMSQFWVTYAQLAVDTNSVVTMRMMGMGGTWSVPDSEASDMIREKAPAFTEAMMSGALAAWSGRGPDRVMQAAIEPISEAARLNRTRLAQRGPKLFGFASNDTNG